MVYFTCISTSIQMLIDIGGDQSSEEQLWVYTIALLVINVCSLAHYIVINFVKQTKLRDKAGMTYEEFKRRLDRVWTGIIVQYVFQSILVAIISLFVIAVFAKIVYDF